MFTRRRLLAGTGVLAGSALLPWSTAAAQPAAPHALADFFKRSDLRDAALSPDGGRIAVLRTDAARPETGAMVEILDAAAPEKLLVRMPLNDGLDAKQIEWGSEDRLLIWVDIAVEQRLAAPANSNISAGTLKLTARRVVSAATDGGAPVTLFADSRALSTNFDLGSVVDLLPDDPRHILMAAWDYRSGVLALHTVDIVTGKPEIVERGAPSTVGWITAAGRAVLRFDSNLRGTVHRVYARAPGTDEWKFVRRTRTDQLPDFFYVGPTEDPAVILAGVRVEGEDTVSVRKLDLRTLAIGEAVSSRPGRDVVAGLVDERSRYLGARYLDDRIAYDFVDPGLGKHFAGMNAFFGRECNVKLFDVDAAQNRFLAHVSGPREPGAFYFYDKAAKRLENLGARQPELRVERLGPTTAVKVATRDGASITAYLTAPSTGAPGPLVVLPHGGPELRDSLDWDRQVQVLAAQGWWVLQPNFRGSGGYGRAFAKAGWRRWGERMQEDVEDAVAQVVAANRLDAGRVAIMGSSYGGYAALMGAVRRPDLYKAAIAICGVSDLPEMLDYERGDDDTPDKEIYRFWVDRIGDPKADAAMLETASPRRRAAEIRCPVLLVHGKDDAIVPVKQSRFMADALKKAGASFELVEVPDAGHGDWKDEVEKDLMGRYVALLQRAFHA
ncbi:alpha/beta fold hydrolase [Caulobacter sp. 17J65-9]|uniref:alpha/beta hydrolase family protein n=1 Tax=Caulobacter sp. 17J65-9 TaxID=2709382 RepID=UPI0013C7FA7E|nr:alpha/beta fold hydrolase [Caulobacter sp. 17J65-9]NEX93355.1 S9 family peptidase [Caulobacter sp. 17J65-9]